LERNSNVTLSRLSVAGYAGFVILLVAIGYGRVANAFFVADDFNILSIVESAQSVREATGIAAQWEFFRPLTALTYWANYLVFGKSALAFHTVDLLIHAGNALLVAYLTWSLVPHRPAAGIAGALFAWFPMHGESVAWIAGRFDQIYATGVLLCLTCWLRYVRHGSVAALVGSVGGLLIALGGKDTGMIVPGFLAVFLFAYRECPLRQRMGGVGVMAVVFAGYLALRLWVLDGIGGYKNVTSAPGRIDLETAVAHVADATRFMVAPGDLGLASWITLVALLYIVVRHGALRGFVRRAWPLALSFGFALAPAANTMRFGPDGEASRFLYVPSVFFCIAVGVLLASKRDRGRDSRPWFAAVVLLGCYLFSLWPVVSDWRGAGDRSDEIVVQLRQYLAKRHYEYLFIHDLPNKYHGAYVFRNGFESALVLFVESDVEFPTNGRISRADWDKYAALRRTKQSVYPDTLLLRWMPDTRRLVEP
jgi:hypothetical protein